MSRNPKSIINIAAVAIFAGILCFVMFTTLLVTFLLPERYSSSARLKVQPIPNDPRFLETDLTIMHSEIILDQVIENLKLNEVWGKKYWGGNLLKTPESRALLKRQVDLRIPRNTTLIQITTYSDDKMEAAEISNQIAEVYKQYRIKELQESESARKPSEPTASNPPPAHKLVPVEIIDRAEPNPKPSQPNVYVNALLGAVFGAIAGGIVSGLFLWVASRMQRRKAAIPPLPRTTIAR